MPSTRGLAVPFSTSRSWCGKQVQISFFVARPRASPVCASSPAPPPTPGSGKGEDDDEMITMEPEVIASDDNLVLRINVYPVKDMFDGADLLHTSTNPLASVAHRSGFSSGRQVTISSIRTRLAS